VYEYEETGGRFKINGYFYNFSYESKTKYKYFVCNKSRCAIRCHGSITISPNKKIVKKIEHICNVLKNNKLKSIATFEKMGRKLRGKKTLIDGYFYHFRHESIKKNKYYVCSKRNCPIKCRGSITIAPNSQVIKRIEHICNKPCNGTKFTERDTGDDPSTPKGSSDRKHDHSRSGISQLAEIEEIQEGNTTPGSITSTPSKSQVHSMVIDNQDFEEIQMVFENSKNSDPQVGQNSEKVRIYFKKNIYK
jgi:hypothetical protein